MWESFRGVARSLVRNPEELSSAAPLLVVLGILCLLVGGMIFVIIRTLRAPHWEPEATEEIKPPEAKNEEADAGLVFLNEEDRGKWRRFFKRHFFKSFDDSAYQAALAELAHLRFLLEKMEKDNAQLREQLAKALHRNDELSYEYKGFDQKINTADGDVKSAHEQMKKSDERIAQLENQLRDTVAELDKIYEQNEKALLEANTRNDEANRKSNEMELQMAEFIKTLEQVYRTGNLGKLVAIAPSLQDIKPEPDPELSKYRTLCESQDQELAKMKHVLKIAKEQIVVLKARS